VAPNTGCGTHARDERRQVADCLGSLTDALREAIQLAYYDG
jgi:RNA polymerase sigma-70 factor (ECF subfamily)